MASTREPPRSPGQELRDSGIGPVGAVPWGTHFCQFYQTREDLVETLVPYFRAGLEGNELCMWVTSPPLGVAEATAALRDALPGLDAYLESGQLEILDSSQWYTRSGRFEAEPVLQGWVDKVTEALRRGFAGLRLSGNTFWLEQDTWDEFTRYEEAVNEVIGQHPMIALCTYSLERCGIREIVDVVANHRFALIKREGRWEIIEQAAHGKTEQALRDSEERHRTLFERMTEGFALHEILLDDQGQPSDYRFLEVNPAFERLTGLERATVVGRTVREVLPGVEARWVDTYGRVAITGEPVRFEEHAAALGRDFEVLAYSPRPGQFAVLFSDVTERKLADARLAWLASFPTQNPNPVVEVDLSTGTVSYANPAASERFPEVEKAGLDHPWLDGVAAIAEELEVSGAASTFREVEVDGWWCRQSFALVGPGRVIRVYGIDVTDRVRAQQTAEAATEEAVEERNRLEAVMEALPVGVAIVDAVGGSVRSNSSYEAIWRGPRPLPRSVEDYATYRAWWPDTGRPVQPDEWASARAVRNGETVVGQLMKIERFDGTRAMVHNSAAPVLDARGRVAGAAVAILDVTELKQVEEELRRQREWLRVTLTSIGDAVLASDADGRITFMNPVAEAVTGWGRDEALGQPVNTVFRVVNDQTRQPLEDLVAAVLHEGRVIALANNAVLMAQDGREVPIEDSAAPIVDADGSVLGAVLVFHDVTEKRRGRAALRASEERLRLVLQASRMGTFEIDLVAGTELWNSTEFELLGLEPGDVSPGPDAFFRFVHPDDVELLRAQWQEALQGGTLDTEFRVVRADGEVRWLAGRGRAVLQDPTAPGAPSRVLRFVGVNFDVTERRQAEEGLRHSREDLARAQSVGQIGSWRLDVRRDELLWSDESWRIFGVPPGTPLTYQTFLDTIHPDDRADVHEKWSAALRGEPYDVEHRIVVGDAVKWVRERAELELDSDGHLLGGFGTTQDVTERKLVEEQIRATLEEKEVLLREIHHRVKNNLQIIASMLNLQLSGITDESARAPLVESQNRVRTLALIHEKLYGSKDFTAIPLHTYLAELTSFVHRSFGDAGRQVRVDLDLDEIDLEVGTAIPTALIANELLSNAFKHAFPSGRTGRITVGLRRLSTGRVELSVADDGVGLPADLDIGNTASLGLQLVSILTTQLQGTIEPHRESGTRFVLAFGSGFEEGKGMADTKAPARRNERTDPPARS